MWHGYLSKVILHQLNYAPQNCPSKFICYFFKNLNLSFFGSLLALHHVRGWTFSYIHRGTVMRGTIELMQDNLGKVTMSHQVECDINTYIIDIIITLDLHWYQVTRTYDIHGSVSDKVNGFCKCLIFPKSGFSRFSNLSGCQDWTALAASNWRSSGRTRKKS